MQWLASICVRRPVFALVLIASVCVFGIGGYLQLGVDKFPRVDFPFVTITTLYPGTAPSAIETDVTEKIEAAVNTVGGVEQVSSVSTEGASLVFAQFALEKDGAEAAAEVEQRVAAIVSTLPDGAYKPEVVRADPDDAPVAVMAIRGPDSIRDVTEVAEQTVKAALERIDGVGRVSILGGQKRQITVEVDPLRLAAKGVSALEVMQAIASSNVSFPGGRLDAGPLATTMRIESRAPSPDKLASIVVRQMGASPIVLGDVATVLDDAKQPDSAAVHDGKPTVVLSVRKQSGRNTVETVERVKSEMANLKAALPRGYTLDLVRDNSELIRTSTHTVLEHLVVGALLAALIVLFFLGDLRSTIIAAVAIPVSIVSTFGLMKMFGFTLNMMTLLALALAVGIVIDDAIVVLENIHRYIEEKHMKPFPAAIYATKEIGLAVLATTISLMAVFLPVAFMSGIVGRFLFGFGMTMAFAIFVSMLVSFSLTPMMAARMVNPHDSAHPPGKLARIVDNFYRPIERTYVRALDWCMDHRWAVVAMCVGSCLTMGFTGPRIGNGFIPLNDEAQFEIFVQAPEGTTLDATTILTERIARKTRDVPGVAHTVVTIGDTAQKQGNVGKVYVRLVDPKSRSENQDELMDQVRKQALHDLPTDVRAGVQRIEDFNVGGGQNFAVQYMITGPDLDQLTRYGKLVGEKLRNTPGVADFDANIPEPVPELALRPDLKRAASLGVQPGDISATLAALVGGRVVSTFEERGRQYDVFVQAPERFRQDAQSLGLMMVPTRNLPGMGPSFVPLSDVVRSEAATGPSRISRNQRSRSLFVQCNVAPGFSEADVTKKVTAAIADLGMPSTYQAGPFGRSKEAAKIGAAFMTAIGLAFLFMYLVLAAQFESWLHPLTILLALPLTMPFALFSLLIFKQQIDIFTMLGILVLFGMVKKNSILQVDQANQQRAKGLDTVSAMKEAARERLRPILMTTLAFVAGMIPLVTSQGVGAGFSKAMAGVVVGGQTLSLVLTLLAIPVFYVMLDDLKGKVWHRLGLDKPSDRGQNELPA